MSALSEALSAWSQDPSPSRREACFLALREAVVYLSVARPGVERTGKEPHFTLSTVSGRTFPMSHPEPGVAILGIFSDRASADAWSERVPGFTTEPVPAPAAADFAMRAGATLLIVDPLRAAFAIERREIEWARCPRRPLATTTFAAAFPAWRDAPGPQTFAAVTAAFADTVFHARQSRGGAGAVVGSRTLPLEEDGGYTYLTVSTDRSAVERWCGEGETTLAVDGPAAAEIAALLGVDLGLVIANDKALALDATDLGEWPRRAIGPADF